MNTAIISSESQQLANAGEYGLIPAETDDRRLVELWAGKPRRSTTGGTAANYLRFWVRFRGEVGKPIQAITYDDLDRWVNGLAGAPATRKTAISYCKSLFSFAARVGYIRLNPAAAIGTPGLPATVHKKVMDEGDVHALIHAATCRRDRVLIRCLYSSGCRISELLGLTWGDVVAIGDGRGELHVFGKGGKPRPVVISADTFRQLIQLRQGAGKGDPVFVSNRGNAMDRTVVHRMIRQAARDAGIDGDVSAHWLRHSHASHAIKRGASLGAVRDQLGHSALSVTSVYVHADDTSADYLSV